MKALAISGNIFKTLRCVTQEYLASIIHDDELGGLPCLEADAASYFGNICKMSQQGTSSARLAEVPVASLNPVAKLGEGGFGAVFLVQSEVPEGSGHVKSYALKRMSLSYIREQDVLSQVRAEIDILALVDSPFVVGFNRSFIDDSFIYILMEPATGGHLHMLMCEHESVLLQDEPRGSSAKFYAACISGACGYLHERHVAYRDLKLENVLLDSRGYAKLCDMGFARFLLGKTRTFLGTPDYMAPEIIDAPHDHDTNVDWWALGVLTYELLVGHGPWNTEDEDHENPWGYVLAVREQQKKGFLIQQMPRSLTAAKDFVKQLLSEKPWRRLGFGGVAEVRRHAWFAGFDFGCLDAQTLPTPFTPAELALQMDIPQSDLFARPGSPSKSTVSESSFTPFR